MIAACYDSFIISRRVIPRNPAPQFIHRDVRFFIDVTSKRKGRRGVNELHEGADAASSKRIMPAQQFSLRQSVGIVTISVVLRTLRIIAASLNPLVLTNELSRHP